MKNSVLSSCAVLLCLFAATAFPSCAQKTISAKQWKHTTRVCYRNENGSLPPEHQFSISISVDKDSIICNVYRSGRLAGSIREGSSEALFNKLKSRLAAQGLSSVATDENAMLPRGGDITSIACYANGSKSPYFSAFSTGGEGTLILTEGSASDAFNAVLPMPVDAIMDKFPGTFGAHAAGASRTVMIKTIDDGMWPRTTRVYYNYTAASVAPDYHRSYSIDICKDSIVVDITSYGNHLLHAVYPFTEKQFSLVKAQLQTQGFGEKPRSNESPTTGGSFESVAFYADGNSSPYYATTSDDGIATLYVQKGRAIDAFSKALPESIETLIERTR